MKKLTALVLIILTLLIPAACSNKTEFADMPRSEFTTTDLKTKEFDEVVITYPAYMDIFTETEKLSLDSEGDFEISYFDVDTLEELWVVMLTMPVEGSKAEEFDKVFMQMEFMDEEDPMEVIETTFCKIGGLEVSFTRFDMLDEFYDEYGTEYWIVLAFDYDKDILYSFNVMCDEGMSREDAYAIISNLEFR